MKKALSKVMLALLAFELLAPFTSLIPKANGASTKRLYYNYEQAQFTESVTTQFSSSNKKTFTKDAGSFISGTITSIKVYNDGVEQPNKASFTGTSITVSDLDGRKITVYGKSETLPGHQIYRQPEGKIWEHTGEKTPSIEFDGEPGNPSQHPGIIPSSGRLRYTITPFDYNVTGDPKNGPDLRYAYISSQYLMSGQSSFPASGDGVKDYSKEGWAVTTAYGVVRPDKWFLLESNVVLEDGNPDITDGDKVIQDSVEIYGAEKHPFTDAIPLSFGKGRDPGTGMIRTMMKIDHTADPRYYEEKDHITGGQTPPYGLLRNYYMYAIGKWKADTYKYQTYIDITYDPPTFPDLSAVSLTIDDACIEVNKDVTVKYSYKNMGPSTLTAFKVYVKVDGVTVHTENTSGGANKGVLLGGQFTYKFTAATSKSFTLSVDEENVLNEPSGTRSNNTTQKSYTAQASCSGGGGSGITGTIAVDRAFIPWGDDNRTLLKVDDSAASCKASKFRVSYQDAGGAKYYGVSNLPFDGVVNGMLEGTHFFGYDDGQYPEGLGSGTINVYGAVLDTCGNWITIGTTSFVIGNEPPDQPPEIEFKWFRSNDLSTPIDRAAIGDSVALKVTKKTDPQGLKIDLEWHFDQSTTWVAGIPAQKSLSKPYNFNLLTGIITADPAGDQEVCLTGKTSKSSITVCEYLEIVPKNPVPVITGSTLVKENRTVDVPFSTSSSYSPVEGRIINHGLDEKGGPWQTSYSSPGTYELSLHVTDNTGLRSLNPDKHTITVFPDDPPIIDFQYQNTLVRNQHVAFRNKSYSPDGDQMQYYQVWLGYDDNNDNVCAPSSLLSGDNQDFDFASNQIGKYCFRVYAQEDYGKSAEKTYWVDVINDAPEATFTASGEVQEPASIESYAVSTDAMLGWVNTTLDAYNVGAANGYSKMWNGDLMSGAPRTVEYNLWGYNEQFSVQPNVISSKNIIGFFGGEDGTASDYVQTMIYPDLVILRKDDGYAFNPFIASSRFSPKSLGGAGLYIEWNYATNELLTKAEWSTNNNNSCATTIHYEIKKYRLSDLNNGVVSVIDSSTYTVKGFLPACNYVTTTGSILDFSDGTRPWNIITSKLSTDEHYETTVDNGSIIGMTKRPDGSRTLTITDFGSTTPRVSKNYSRTELDQLCGGFSGIIKFVSDRTFSNKIIVTCYSFSPRLVTLLTLDQNAVLTPFFSQQTGDSGIFLVPVNYSNGAGDILRVDMGYSWQGGALSNEFDDPFWATIYHSTNDYGRFYFDKNFTFLGNNLPSGKQEPNYQLDVIERTLSNSTSNSTVYFGNTIVQGAAIKTFIPDYSQGASNEHYVKTELNYSYSTMLPRTNGQLLSNQQLSNFTLNTRMKYSFEPHSVIPSGLSFRAVDHKNMYRLEFRKNLVILQKIVNGRKTELSRQTTTLTKNTWYDIQVKAIGNNLRVYLGGFLLIDVNDSSFTYGSFGPFAEQEYVQFSKVSYGILPASSSSFIDGFAIVDEPVKYVKTYHDPENDPAIPARSEWTFTHTNPYIFRDDLDGKSGQEPVRVDVNEKLVFSKVGEYKIDYRIPDDPNPSYLNPKAEFDSYRKYSPKSTKSLIVHRKPKAPFLLSVGADLTVIWTDQSYDPDRCSSHQSGCHPGYGTHSGINAKKFYYVTPSGQSVPSKLVRPQENGVYTVAMAVQDEFAAWSDWFVTTITINQPPPPNIPPTVELTFPLGTQSNPTPVSLLPTVYWNQNDSNPGTIFSTFNLRVVEENGICAVWCENNRVMDTTAASWAWTLDTPLQLGFKYSAQVQVSDGETLSGWSNTGWMINNRPPTATMTVPNGLQSAPTIFSKLRPTLQWSQTDPDPGTTFTYFQIQITNEANTVMILDSGQYWQGTTSTTGTWTVTSDLPAGQKLRVRVCVFDGYVWSEFSPQTWLYINRPPAANFDWSPKPVWEGDTVTLTNQSSDPDGDPLTYAWKVRRPDGVENSYTTTHVNALFHLPGNYEVTLTASDGIASNSVTKTIQVLPLTILSNVSHTSQWLEHHIRKGHNTTVRPLDFYSGEILVVDTRSSPAPVAEAKAWIDAVGIDGRSLYISQILEASSDMPQLYEGELFDERLLSVSEGLPAGDHEVHVQIVYGNGVVREESVPIHIIGNVNKSVGVHRVQ